MDLFMSYSLRLLVIIFLSFCLSACFTPKGKVRLKTDISNAKLYHNSAFKMDISKNFVEFEVEAEKLQTFNVKALSEDEEWEYTGTVSVTIAKDSTSEVVISTDRNETPKRIARIAHEKKLKEAMRVARRVKSTWKERLANQGVEQ